MWQYDFKMSLKLGGKNPYTSMITCTVLREESNIDVSKRNVKFSTFSLNSQSP